MVIRHHLQDVPEEVLAARAVYKEYYQHYQDEIKPLAKSVCNAGGLFVIGTERHESRRIDNQLRGRSGRQGDPGESRFFLSLEDDLMRLFGSERVIGVVSRLGLGEDDPIDAKILSNTIENAQKRLEGDNFNRRKHVLEYDDVMNQQRTLIYSQRKEVLDGNDISEKIKGMISSTINDTVNSCAAGEDRTQWDIESIRQKYLGLICSEDDFKEDDITPEQIKETLLERAFKLYEEKEQVVFGPEQMREVERAVLLRNVDTKWMDHLEAMDSLMESVGLQAYAQRKPIDEYRILGADLFDEMITMIRDDTARMILSVMPASNQIKRAEVAKPVKEGFAGTPGAERPSASGASRPSQSAPPVKSTPIRSEKKVGRNDPCPCGSGKKYKNCCGAVNNNSADAQD